MPFVSYAIAFSHLFRMRSLLLNWRVRSLRDRIFFPCTNLAPPLQARLGFKPQANSESPLKWTKENGFQSDLSDFRY